MRLSDVYYHSYTRCRLIGRALVDGPLYLQPPKKVRHYGALSYDLLIINLPTDGTKDAFSWSLFTDWPIFSFKEFLTPVVRFAYWNRSYEYAVKRIRKWPVVTITHHVLSKKEQERINFLLRKLDRCLSKVKFIETGLLSKDSAPVECFPEPNIPNSNHPIYLRIVRYNGLQKMDLSLGGCTTDNQHIKKVAHAISEYIKFLCLSSSEQLPYLEFYEKNLKMLGKPNKRWSYRPSVSKRG